MLFIISIIALVLLIWFRTEAWLEYCRLLGFDAISFYDDFSIKQKNDALLTYHIYLRRYHNCFFVRLITCPICLGTWVTAILLFLRAMCILLLLATAHHLTIAAIIIVLFNSIKLFPLILLVGLSVYGIVDRLLS